MNEKYSVIIGMEVHTELKTKSKMFCSCKNDPETNEANTYICEICTGQPGTLPVPNKTAIEWCAKIGKALGCNIRENSKFDRKHYFYPDLPKAYQISQYDEPVAEHGSITLEFPLEDNIREIAEIGIERVHMEEDTAKLLHDNDGATLVDFNRSSVPLVEIVTKPDFKSALEAKTFCQELQRILQTLDVSDAQMNKGQMRCEVNVSVQATNSFEINDGKIIPFSGVTLNPKVEVKNINSFKAVEKAIEFEIERQIKMIEEGEEWVQQTRGWDENKSETVLQRTKENAADYRYFPEPDIPPFSLKEIAENIRIPELPIAKRKRFKEEYGFSYSDSFILTEDKHWANFTENVMSELFDWLHSLPEVSGSTDEIREKKRNQIARLAGSWLTTKLKGALSERSKDIRTFAVTAENFAELIALLFTGRTNPAGAAKILEHMLDAGTDIDPTHVMEEYGYGQMNDESKLEEIILETISSYPKQVEEYKNGKETLLKFLIGMVMKATEGSANPGAVEKILKENLG